MCRFSVVFTFSGPDQLAGPGQLSHIHCEIPECNGPVFLRRYIDHLPAAAAARSCYSADCEVNQRFVASLEAFVDDTIARVGRLSADAVQERMTAVGFAYNALTAAGVTYLSRDDLISPEARPAAPGHIRPRQRRFTQEEKDLLWDMRINQRLSWDEIRAHDPVCTF